MYNKIKSLRNNPEKAREYFIEHLAFTMGPVELKNLIDEDNAVILDVRRSADYEVSHINGALSIPKDELADNISKLDKNSVTVVYSYNSHCHLAFEASLILADYGYPCVVLSGGFKP